PMAELVAALVLRRSGGLAVGTRDRFAAFDPRDGSLRPLATLAPMPASARINDARCDRAGRLWSGTMDMGVRPDRGALFRVAADGTLEREIVMPVPRPTGCAFGGRNLDTLYIASARVRLPIDVLEAAPLSGGLFAIKPGVRGVAEGRYAG